MAFNVVDTHVKQESDKPKVDWDALNKHVVDTAQLTSPETIVGIVSMIVDLGVQNLQDASVQFNGSEEDEAKEIAENPNTYFKDEWDYTLRKNVRKKCWPQKPQQCVAFAIDFPEIVVDKGQFFGESNPLPLRLWLGGKRWVEGTGMIVDKPVPMKVTNLDKSRKTTVWSFAANSTPYKMAAAAKLVKSGEAFLPKQLDELLGQAFQFEASVFFKEKDGKSYYNEKVAFKAALGRGQTAPSSPVKPQLIQFTVQNDVEAIKSLPQHILNTIKLSPDFEKSVLKKQMDVVLVKEDEKPVTSTPTTPAQDDDDDFDEGIPF